jgi:heterodisulfide reductase subunit A
MDVFDPSALDEYGYSRFPNVITSLEFERLISSFGPTKGELVRPSDGKLPKTVAFIQCVGSRTEKNGKPYCSNICCMNTVKDTLLIKDHWPGVDCKVFYIDIRAFGKGFEDLYKRSRGEGVEYIRGIPGLIEQDAKTGDLTLTVENVQSAKVEKHTVGMVVLSIGVEPRRDSGTVKGLLSLSYTPDGFFMEAHPKLMPVDAPTKGVFFAGCAESPKDVKDSVSQASAAAARANRLMRKGSVTVEAITSMVNDELCRSCGICENVCPYHAITVDKENKKPAVVVEAACAGCGTCAAECPFGAISMRHFSDDQMEAQIDAMLADNPQDKVLVFACNWCSYAGADTAGISRLQYPPSVRLIRTMCSGRVDSKFIERAFMRGAAIVLVSGCHFADCHYISANRWTQKRVEKMWDKLDKMGIRPERLQLEWISAAEGQKFARTMAEMEELRRKVTKEEIEETIRAFKEAGKPKKPKKEKVTAS